MRLIPLTDKVGIWTARYVAESINKAKPTAEKPFVLGLLTGSTPLEMYGELIRLNSSNKLSFEHVITFNMDEYVGIPADHPESYRTFMYTNFFDHVNIQEKNINLLNGLASDLKAEGERYENKILSVGGIDLFIGGVGIDGHIAFNEPGSSLSSKTRDKELTWDTRVANSRFFNNDPLEVPEVALTVGVGTLLASKQVLIMTKGREKAMALHKGVEGSVSHLWTISALQLHENAIIVCDKGSQEELKVKTLNYFKEIEEKNIHYYLDAWKD